MCLSFEHHAAGNDTMTFNLPYIPVELWAMIISSLTVEYKAALAFICKHMFSAVYNNKKIQDLPTSQRNDLVPFLSPGHFKCCKCEKLNSFYTTWSVGKYHKFWKHHYQLSRSSYSTTHTHISGLAILDTLRHFIRREKRVGSNTLTSSLQITTNVMRRTMFWIFTFHIWS